MTECRMPKECHNNPSSFPAAKHGATECVVNMTVLLSDCSDLSFGKGLSVLRVILRDDLICLIRGLVVTLQKMVI